MLRGGTYTQFLTNLPMIRPAQDRLQKASFFVFFFVFSDQYGAQGIARNVSGVSCLACAQGRKFALPNNQGTPPGNPYEDCFVTGKCSANNLRLKIS